MIRRSSCSTIMFADGEEILIQKETVYWTSLVYYENGSPVSKWLINLLKSMDGLNFKEYLNLCYLRYIALNTWAVYCLRTTHLNLSDVQLYMYIINWSRIWDCGLRSGLYRYLVSQESGVAGFTVHTILRWRSCLINDVSNRLQCTALRGLQCPATL